MPERREWTAPAPADRLDKALVVAFPDLSRARVQALIAEGAVSVDGQPARASARVVPGQVVVLALPEVAAAEPQPQDIPVPVLHDDDDLIVVVKPAGMVVHPSAGHDDGTLVNALLHQASGLSGIGGVSRPGIVHRLDGGTSGVMVVAKHDVAHRALTAQFAVHSVERRYLAVVHRVPNLDRGSFRSQLARDPDDRLRIASVESGGREAITHWAVRARGDRVALVECRLETGRTHQVRVHLSEAGHPILGDRTYARRDCVAPGPLRAAVEALTHPLLHAYCLAFDHPDTQKGRLRFVAPPPPDFVDTCRIAGLAIPAIA
ncbi:MAG: RluA family pseudouridine synthase [Deltaproteobacteria bacterium]|nr:RluA family pseudouridine synthase [Deltaproteobacteria bacterium]